MKAIYTLIFLFLIIVPPNLLWATEGIEGFSHEEALLLGENIYRSGVLPTGKPLKAYVMGDIPVDGRMFTCDDCHQRSGLGSEEGTIVTWPTNGRELFAPRYRSGAFKTPESEAEKQNIHRVLPSYYNIQPERPAYTDKSLAKVLVLGRDPSGRKIDPIMPRYRLNKSNLALLIYYLKNLSTNISPGVSDSTLQFATVITENVTVEEKAAMLSVLQAHMDAHNSQSRHDERRAKLGPFYKSEKYKAYRKLNLQVWELTGSEETWRGQLEAYYKKNPVFAFLGGITDGSWEKIHVFCEDHKIPCLFPVTELPVISESDWYTLYFSKGYYQEGESAAKYIRATLKTDKKLQIVQVYQQNNSKSIALARGFEQTWKKMDGSVTDNLVLRDNDTIDKEKLNILLKNQDPVVLLLWLDNADALSKLDFDDHQINKVFVSANLLDNNFSAIAEGFKEKLLLTYPYSLAKDKERNRFVVKRWLETQEIPIRHFDIQAKMYFLGWMLSGALKSMRSEYFRDFFIERFDMMIDQDYAIAVYPRLTFGSGQRYASKGCYIGKLTKGQNPELVPVSNWVTY